MSSADHFNAVVARIKGAGAQALSVHDTTPSSPVYPYVVVYFDGGVAGSDREADERIQKRYSWSTTTVGTSPAQCRAALDRVHDRQENWVPVVPGRTCTKVEHEIARRILPDDELPDRILYYAVDEWSTVSDPA